MRNSRRRGPLFVCLVGMDGAGKTTQAKALVAALSARGDRCMSVPGRWDANTLKPVLKAFAWRYRKKGVELKDYSQRMSWKKQLFKNRFLSFAYRSFVFATYVAQVWRKVSIPRAFGWQIVCDRYVYDMTIDVAFDFGYSAEKANALANSLLRITPKPDLVFLLDLDEDLAMRRDRPKGEGFPPGYFVARRKMYKHLAERQAMAVCDAEESIEGLTGHIQKLVFAELERPR